jgi:hypothetical protein
MTLRLRHSFRNRLFLSGCLLAIPLYQSSFDLHYRMHLDPSNNTRRHMISRFANVVLLLNICASPVCLRDTSKPRQYTALPTDIELHIEE